MSSAWQRTVPFAPFVALFADLGWKHRLIAGSHHLFEQPRTDFQMVLPLPKRGRLPMIYVPAISRTLDELGEMSRDAVERRLTPTPGRPHTRGH